jgi:chromosome segregation ATPase
VIASPREAPTVAEEEIRTLERKFNRLNNERIKTNARIGELEAYRASIELELKRTARKLHDIRATRIKEDYARGRTI